MTLARAVADRLPVQRRGRDPWHQPRLVVDNVGPVDGHVEYVLGQLSVVA